MQKHTFFRFKSTNMRIGTEKIMHWSNSFEEINESSNHTKSINYYNLFTTIKIPIV